MTILSFVVHHLQSTRGAQTYSTIQGQFFCLVFAEKSSIMSSRFFHGGDSDSESSSSDEEELYSDHEEESEEESSEEEEDEEESEEEESSEDEGRAVGASRFLKPSGGAADESDESDEDDRERVVKSAKDKRLEELEGTIKLIENAEKINDWAVISTGKASNASLHHLHY